MKKFDQHFFTGLIHDAQASKRKRVSYNIHQSGDDLLQRMYSALEPLTYVRPHKHRQPPKRELFVLLTGRVLVIEYDNDGNISDYALLEESGIQSVEIAPGVFHHIIAISESSIVFELKDGPYDPSTDKEFAS